MCVPWAGWWQSGFSFETKETDYYQNNPSLSDPFFVADFPSNYAAANYNSAQSFAIQYFDFTNAGTPNVLSTIHSAWVMNLRIFSGNWNVSIPSGEIPLRGLHIPHLPPAGEQVPSS